MSLISALNALPLLRPLGLPLTLRNVCLICMRADLPRVEDFLRRYPHAAPRLLTVVDIPAKAAARLRVELPDGQLLPAVAIDALDVCPEYEKALICPENQEMIAPLLTSVCRYLVTSGVRVRLPASWTASIPFAEKTISRKLTALNWM